MTVAASQQREAEAQRPRVAVETHELSRRFGDFTAVDSVTFEVAAGTVLGLIGPNGAGKTTLIRMLCGLLPPSSGSARVLGFDAVRQSQALRARIGYMSQRFSLYDDLTVEENLLFYGRLYGLKHRELRQRKERLLEWSQLADHRRRITHSLPTGWRQRLAFACATVHEPELLFLDEPTSGMDPLSRRRFWSMIYDLAAEGRTVIVTTHAMEEAEYCDLVALMNNGKLAALGTPRELVERWTGSPAGRLIDVFKNLTFT